MGIYGENFVDGHRYPWLGEVCRGSAGAVHPREEPVVQFRLSAILWVVVDDLRVVPYRARLKGGPQVA